ncbi:MAG: NnrS family protein [Myxococcota bacterium]
MTDARFRLLKSRGFRPFFLLAAAQAVLAIGLWLAMLQGLAPPPAWSTPFGWHAHEMLFGFAGAAIAGFLLTSVPVWTGRPAIAGGRLAALTLLWLAGRLAGFFAACLPSLWIAAALDASFLALLALAIGPSIYGSRSRRNYAFPLLVGLLATADLLTHLGATSAWPGASGAGSRLGVGVVVLLVATLGGRLVPLFTEAALKRAGTPRRISHLAWADAAAGPVLGGFVLADTVWPDGAASGALAGAAAVTLALRMKGWGLWHARRDPLLWSMHLAYLFLPTGLAALGVSVFSTSLTRSTGLHALTVGAIGGMILAIMTRVALGHTGRPLRAPPGIPAAYALVLAAGLTRTAAPLLLPAWTGGLLVASGLLWMAGFAIFLAVYAPILLAPRVDGQPA